MRAFKPKLAWECANERDFGEGWAETVDVMAKLNLVVTTKPLVAVHLRDNLPSRALTPGDVIPGRMPGLTKKQQAYTTKVVQMFRLARAKL